jgi:hypothetical protein
VEVGEAARRQLEEAVARGYALSVQDLVRRAIDGELERLADAIRTRAELEPAHHQAPRASVSVKEKKP